MVKQEKPMKYKTLYRVIALSVCALSTTQSFARIKLITLPVREHVEIQLENKNTTIIEEERIVPLKKGNNDIDFSWHNTSIRPETIVFRVIDGSSDVHDNTPNNAKQNAKQSDIIKTNVISVSYPPNESALTWNVYADKNGTARVRITYAINKLDRKYHYIARTNSDETNMQLMQYIKVNNQSGESYLNAQMSTGMDHTIALPMGLDESQEFLNQSYDQIPIEKTYTVNASELGYRNRSQDKLNVYMHYHIVNDKQHNLGKQSFAPGKFRIYQQDKKGSSVFIGEDWGQYTAKEDEAKLFIGEARDIVVKRIIKRQKRQRINGNLYNWNVLLSYEIENFKDKPVNLIIEEDLRALRGEVFASRNNLIEWEIGKETSFSGQPLKKYTTGERVAYQISLPARQEEAKQMTLEKKLHINFKNEW